MRSSFTISQFLGWIAAKSKAMEQTRLLGNNLKPLTYEDAKNIYAQLFQ